MSENAIEEAKSQHKPEQARQPYIPIACEVDLFMMDKFNEKLVTIDQPQILPNGMLQCHCGDKICLYNPSNIRRVEIRVIRPNENRIIT